MKGREEVQVVFKHTSEDIHTLMTHHCEDYSGTQLYKVDVALPMMYCPALCIPRCWKRAVREGIRRWRQ